MGLVRVHERQMTWKELSQIKISKLNEDELISYKAQIFWGYRSSLFSTEVYNFIMELIKQAR